MHYTGSGLYHLVATAASGWSRSSHTRDFRTDPPAGLWGDREPENSEVARPKWVIRSLRRAPGSPRHQVLALAA